ncbi:MAG: hypothetical protein C9356_15865 [Oleiphilus sp.]|nr:MAG: hypothetical protein C9356_15865 [Oleiphilus sp.]
MNWDAIIAVNIIATAIVWGIAIRMWWLRRQRLEYIGRCDDELADKSVDDLVAEVRAERETLEARMGNGRGLFAKLKQALNQVSQESDKIAVGLVPPIFGIEDSERLKHAVRNVRQMQYACIKNGAAMDSGDWIWEGSRAKGKEMVNDCRLLMLKAFNAEFEVIRRKMRASTYDGAYEKLERLREQFGRLGETARVRVSFKYSRLKHKELEIWHEELEHREAQKQEKKRQQALLREQNKQGIEDTEELDEEIAECDSELRKARAKAEALAGEERKALEKMIAQIAEEKAKLEKKFARATSQAQVTRAGYVYVISNIGCFGEGVVKIGMTRRLEPMDRVNELGDASVPFKFDVHTLAFVPDAPTLEKALHARFDKMRVNTENLRKEFFRVTAEQVQTVMEEMGVEADWYMEAEAREYYESCLRHQAMQKQAQTKVSMSDSLPASI